ncbi:hypothetical protein [uncultured Draconibacterium sp.]|uniref:hypothetical protein n=1 Tax=uncultured Draconibacterium sp. TaxID=1573823 RepID=UPI003217AD12
MEYAELEQLWKTYDSKLNHLERLNKRLMVETLSRKPQKRINWLQYKNYYGLIMAPIILIFALHPQIQAGSLDDAKFVAGIVLLLVLIGYNTWHFITMINKLKKVDLINDSVIKSADRLNDYKSRFIARFKSVYVSMPVTLAGVLLIAWEDLHFGQNLYILIIFLSLFTVIWGNKQLQVFKKRMNKLVHDINELNEYKE